MGKLEESNWSSVESSMDNTEVFLHTRISPEALQSRCQDVVTTWLMVQGAAGKVFFFKKAVGQFLRITSSVFLLRDAETGYPELCEANLEELFRTQ